MFRNKQKDFIEIKTHNGAEGNNEKLSSFFHSNLVYLLTDQTTDTKLNKVS